MKAVQITEFGGPEVLRPVDLPPLEARPGLLLLDVDAAGVNFADTHLTENSYLSPTDLPLVPGSEVVGHVREGGLAGRRVVALVPDGGYAEQVLVDPAALYPLPDAIDDVDALALVVQGLTAWHLLRTATHLVPGESVLVHSGAGGVGNLAVQLAREWGAGRVVATASGEHKQGVVTSLGADAVVDTSGLTSAREVTEALVAANGGHRFDVVLEMTGGHVFTGSLDALAPLGRLVTFGLASRQAPPPVKSIALMSTSRTVGGFWLPHATGRPGGFRPAMEELTSLVHAGRLRPLVGGTFPLEAAADAHRELLSRRTVGKLALVVARSPAVPVAATGAAVVTAP